MRYNVMKKSNEKYLLSCLFALSLIFCLPISAFAARCGFFSVGLSFLMMYIFLSHCVLLIMTIISSIFPRVRLTIIINFLIAILIYYLFRNVISYVSAYTDDPFCFIEIPKKITTIYAWTVINILISFIIPHNSLGKKIENIFDSFMGQDKILSCIKTGNQKELEFLILNGENVNKIMWYGWTPIFHASRYNKKEIVELLISKGADINILDKNGNTALDYAQTDDMKQFLISHGAKSGKELKEESKENLKQEVKQ